MLYPYRFVDDFGVDFERVPDPKSFDFVREVFQNLNFTGVLEILLLGCILGVFWEAIWHHIDTLGGMLPHVLALWGIMQPLCSPCGLLCRPQWVPGK